MADRIRIATKDGSSVSVVRLYGVGALAVTHWVPLDNDVLDTIWRITHVPSGLAISDAFYSFDRAKRALRAFLPLTDWYLPADSLKNDAELSASVGRIVKEIEPDG